MKRSLFVILGLVLALTALNRASAVELLISGDFETPGGAVGEVPGWEVQEFLTGTSQGADTASLANSPDIDLWFKGFAGGRGLDVTQGNFDGDSDVDGRDFLTWQRGNSPAPLSAADLAAWRANYSSGSGAAHYANARIRQSVPAVPGDTYTFQGSSKFEEFYSGFVTTLGDASPFGQIASPTVTQFKLEFLNSSNQIIGSPTILDLRTEWAGNDPGGYLLHTPLVAVAPANAVNVRVIAEAINMAWNGSSTQETPGNDQSAFFNDLSLTRSGAGGDLLTNGNFQAGIPDALDFWNQQEGPQDFTPFNEILRTPTFLDHNHTPGGARSVWLSAFFGYADPPGTGAWSTDEGVDGIISQTVGAVAGGAYTFSGWSQFEANYSGGVDVIATTTTGLYDDLPGDPPSPTRTEIKLEFFDADGVNDPSGPLASFVIDCEADRKLQEDLADDGVLNGTGTANDNIFREHTLNAIAPAGTRFARLTAQMLDGVFNIDPGQSAFFDDFSLQGPAPPGLVANFAVPEPSSLVVLGLGAVLMGLGRNRK